jgi:hypothetical protein
MVARRPARGDTGSKFTMPAREPVWYREGRTPVALSATVAGARMAPRVAARRALRLTDQDVGLGERAGMSLELARLAGAQPAGYCPGLAL